MRHYTCDLCKGQVEHHRWKDGESLGLLAYLNEYGVRQTLDICKPCAAVISTFLEKLKKQAAKAA